MDERSRKFEFLGSLMVKLGRELPGDKNRYNRILLEELGRNGVAISTGPEGQINPNTIPDNPQAEAAKRRARQRFYGQNPEESGY